MCTPSLLDEGAADSIASGKKLIIHFHIPIIVYFCIQKVNDMTAIDLQSNTMHLLQQFDKTDIALWQKVLDALVSIYQEEELDQAKKRAQQKAKIRQMIGVFEQSDTDDWKQVKEDYLKEKYTD